MPNILSIPSTLWYGAAAIVFLLTCVLIIRHKWKFWISQQGNAISLNVDQHQKPWKVGKLMWKAADGPKNEVVEVSAKCISGEAAIFYLSPGSLFSENLILTNGISKTVNVPGESLLATGIKGEKDGVRCVGSVNIESELIASNDNLFGDYKNAYLFTGKSLSLVIKYDINNSLSRQEIQQLCIIFNNAWDHAAALSEILTSKQVEPCIVVLPKKDMREVQEGNFSRLDGLIRKRVLQFKDNPIFDVLVVHIIQATCRKSVSKVAASWLQHRSKLVLKNSSKEQLLKIIENLTDLDILIEIIATKAELLREGKLGPKIEPLKSLLLEIHDAYQEEMNIAD